MKKRILALVALSVALVSCQQQGGKPKADLSNEDSKAFYSVGAMFGERMKTYELTDKEIQAVLAGFYDSAKGSKLSVDPKQYQPKVQALFKARMEKMAEKVKKEGQDYLAKFLKDGATKTESGLAYKIEKPGTGAKPKPEDKVRVHYHGTLIDGTVFDSSVERKEDVTFPLNRVIKGWTEGLQLIGAGGKVKLVIPSELAYGVHGAPPKIPGGATLVFDVELFEINPKPKAAPKKK